MRNDRMNEKMTFTRLCAFLLLLAVALLPLLSASAQSGLPRESFITVEDAVPGGTGPELDARLSAGNDSVVPQVFVNMVNQAMERELPEGEGSIWDDPSLEEYPLDPHELEEYGDSPRVRTLSLTEGDSEPD